VGEINLYYEVHGRGEPLVWINGRHMCQRLFWRHVPVFAKEFKVITFDNRCSGQSDAPDVPCTIGTMVDDLAGLLTAIGIESAHMAGYSMGSKIAGDFAIKYPDRVKSLILVCHAPPNPDTYNFEPEKWIARGLAWLERPVTERAGELFSGVVSEAFIRDNPELAEKMLQIMIEGHGPPHAQRRHIEASYAHNNYKQLPEIKAATLVFAGSADESEPIENMRSMAERIPNTELAVIENGRHFFMWEYFDESNRIMLEFLRKHRSK
jgi:3-oxoadipate enol-lactonase